jgi:ATP-binding cassette subfamily C (CFTR/MRP) protein 4
VLEGCFHPSFASIIQESHFSKEMKCVFQYLFLLALVVGINVLATKLAIFLSFVSEALQGRSITAEKVFTASAILFTMRFSLVNIFVACLSRVIEAHVSLQRIETFLCLDERRDDVLAKSVSAPEIVLQDVSAKWWLMAKTSAIRNVDLRIKNRQLVALTGPVGSGKSSLFSVLLKELDLQSGSVDVRGTISYCSQDPWFFPGNVRQNILFNNEMDEERYQQVVELCALPSDFKMFPFGDQTPVADYGKSLSGGQKCRISMARCLYRKADIYLLDDPLSSVDPAVGKHLFRSIKDFLKDKICILITHQLQYLKSVDNIVVMEKGKIAMMGSYDELHEKDLAFRALLGDVAIKPDTTDHAKTKPKAISTYNANILVEKEDTQRKMGSWALYSFYFRLGGLFTMLGTVFTFLLMEVMWSSADFYLAYW